MTRYRLAAIHIALAAMLLRAMMPAGWMPNPGTGALFTLCSMDGPLGYAPAPGPHNPPPDDSRHAPCPFAMAPHFATPISGAALLEPAGAARTAWSAAQAGAPAQARRHEPQSPRAPPILA